MEPLKRATDSFRFSTQVNLTQLTPWKARNLQDLIQYLKQVPGSVIYHHTHRFLKQHQYLSAEPPNDFAYWVHFALQDELLGEKLFAIDTVRFKSLRELRDKIIATIEEHAGMVRHTREALPGDEFHFKQSISFVMPTPYEAWDLMEFVEGLKKVSVNSLYYHIFEGRMREPFLGTDDFSGWLANQLGETGLAQSIMRMDPYTHTLEGLRSKIIKLAENRLKETGHVPA